MVRRILVPVDRSDHSTAALDHAIEVHEDAAVVLLHVINPTQWTSADDEGELVYSTAAERTAKDTADDLLAAMTARIKNRVAPVETDRRVGGPAREILQYVREDTNAIDQIVMGSKGRRGLDRLLLGSVAERVARRSPVPVTIVH